MYLDHTFLRAKSRERSPSTQNNSSTSRPFFLRRYASAMLILTHRRFQMWRSSPGCEVYQDHYVFAFVVPSTSWIRHDLRPVRIQKWRCVLANIITMQSDFSSVQRNILTIWALHIAKKSKNSMLLVAVSCWSLIPTVCATQTKKRNAFAGHIQFDDPTFCYFCNDEMISGMEKAGVDSNALLDTYIRAINVCTQDRPDDLTVGVHMCRGNFKVCFVFILLPMLIFFPGWSAFYRGKLCSYCCETFHHTWCWYLLRAWDMSNAQFVRSWTKW